MKDIESTILFSSNLPHLRCSLSEYSPSSLKKIPVRLAQGHGSGTAIFLSGNTDVRHDQIKLQKPVRIGGAENDVHPPRYKRLNEAVVS